MTDRSLHRRQRRVARAAGPPAGDDDPGPAGDGPGRRLDGGLGPGPHGVLGSLAGCALGADAGRRVESGRGLGPGGRAPGQRGPGALLGRRRLARTSAALALEAAAQLDAIVAGAPDAARGRAGGRRRAPTCCTAIATATSTWTTSSARSRPPRAAAGTGRRPGATAPTLQRNRAAARRAGQVVAGLAPADLELATEEGGWTVGQALGHLGFWDRFMASRWRAALAAGGASGATVDMPRPSWPTC